MVRSEVTPLRRGTGDGASVEVRRSAWLVEFGSFRLARHRTVGRVIGHRAEPAEAGFGIRALAVSVLAILVVGTPVYLSQASALDGGGYVVSQKVPDTPTAPATRRLPIAVVHPRRRAATASLPIERPPASRAAFDGDEAVAAAWRTGEPQEWAAHGAFGIIVPGAIEHEDGMICRSLSRLTRHPGSADTVARSRQCSVEQTGVSRPDTAAEPASTS